MKFLAPLKLRVQLEHFSLPPLLPRSLLLSLSFRPPSLPLLLPCLPPNTNEASLHFRKPLKTIDPLAPPPPPYTCCSFSDELQLKWMSPYQRKRGKGFLKDKCCLKWDEASRGCLHSCIEYTCACLHQECLGFTGKPLSFFFFFLFFYLFCFLLRSDWMGVGVCVGRWEGLSLGEVED